MAQVAYISKAELDRIRGSVADTQQLESTMEKEDRKRLKELSDTRAAGWPNTLQAQRARKERARQERANAEEAERQEIDRQEAMLRADQRRQQIERANKILFDETDRVRGFHSTLQKADIIQENEALIGYKKQIGMLRKAQEAAFVEQQRQALEQADAAELAKLQLMKDRALQQKTIQMKQVDDFRNRIITERREDHREGLLLKQRAIEEEEEMKQKEVTRRRKAQELNDAVTVANHTLQEFKLKEMEQAKEAERAMEIYAKKKAEVMAERERRVKEKQAMKEAERKRVADQIESNFNDWMSKEKSRLDKDVAERDLKQALDEAARKQRQRDMLAEMHATNSAQLQAKAEAKVRAKQEEAVRAEEWTHRLKELKQEEIQEEKQRLAREKQVTAFQLRQAEMKARKKAASKIEELQEAAQIQLTLREQEEIFRQYAGEWINEYRRQGKSTVPMELYVNKKATLENMR